MRPSLKAYKTAKIYKQKCLIRVPCLELDSKSINSMLLLKIGKEAWIQIRIRTKEIKNNICIKNMSNLTCRKGGNYRMSLRSYLCSSIYYHRMKITSLWVLEVANSKNEAPVQHYVGTKKSFLKVTRNKTSG